VCEHVGAQTLTAMIDTHAGDLDGAARAITRAAYDRGSPDNLSVQIIRVDELPDGDAPEILGRASGLPLPALPEARALFDGYRIVRELHASSRSHIYLAVDTQTEAVVVLKLPSIELRDDPAYLRSFMMEEWIARRIDSPHVLKPCLQSRPRNSLYVATEFIDGQTLGQWMVDNPQPDIETVRGIVEQIAQGLRAFHRMEMLHQDLRPENVMIDKTGTARIIDFGSTEVAGVVEAAPAADRNPLPGTVQYMAPEYLLGERGTVRSDIFSLGVIAYHMLTGRLPYGAEMAQARTRSQQRRIAYQTALAGDRAIPVWIDRVLQKAVHPDPRQRYDELSEFVFDLRHPPTGWSLSPAPLIERNPLLLWKGLSAVLAGTVLVLLFILYGR
ncbi:MAG: protein kinase, partial [Reyranellaceae bacterium]